MVTITNITVVIISALFSTFVPLGYNFINPTI